MAAVRFSLLGRFRAEWNQKILEASESTKATELLCYLLLHRNRPHPRETLAGFLWSEVSTSHSKKYLRQAIWHLQKMLGAQAGGEPILAVETDWLAICPESRLWVDVTVIGEVHAATQAIAAEELTQDQVQQIREAVALYQGDLLEGWYQDWCIFERERYQHIYLLLVDKLLDHCISVAAYAEGAEYGQESLRYDRARERTHRRLMQLYALAGHRTDALRQYRACVEALADELSVEPAQSTQSLYQRICADASCRDLAADPPAEQATRPAADGDLTAQLGEIQTQLRRLQEQMDHCLHSIQDLTKQTLP